MMNKKNTLLIFAFILSLLPTQLWAWDRIGHMLVAQIAYEHLKPDVKKRVGELTHALDSDYPKTNFVRASTWPDWLRGDDISAFDDWHYIDMPYSIKHIKTHPAHRQNIVWAIEQSKHVVQSERAREFEKGFFLRFLTHLVGDIHQPLHCISRYSPEHMHGDKGGNLYKIDSKLAPNLHAYWDEGLGLFKEDMHTLAHQIQQKYPESEFTDQLADTDPAHWAKESYKIARNFVYTTPEKGAVNNVYVARGQAIVEKQIALAGYRLAKILNEIDNG